MIKIILTKPNGDIYHITNNAEIIRTDIPGFKPSGQWLLKGIEHVKRNEFIPFSSITKEKLENITLLYKNGNPQWTVRDSDHGTTRTWGNTTSHGINSIKVMDG